MKQIRLVLAALLTASPLVAQSFTGEVRVLGTGAYAPEVTRAAGYQDPMGPPRDSPMAGVMGDLSFVAGRFRLGPEGLVLRGPERRVWSLGGVARYEFGRSGIRPFGVLGAGGYFWDREITIDVPPNQAYGSWGSDVSAFSLSVGGGVNLGAPAGRMGATAEVRFHRSLERPGLTGARSMATLGLGGRIAW